MFSLWTWKVQNCFKLQTTPPPQHLSRTQFLLKLHSSFNHKKMTGCVSPILPYVTLRLILHFSSLLCKDSRCAERCASELPLKSPPDWTNTLASVDVQKYAATHIPVLIFSELFLIFLCYPETDRSRSILFPSHFIRSATDFALAWLQILFWPNTSLDTPYSTSVIQTPSDLALMV